MEADMLLIELDASFVGSGGPGISRPNPETGELEPAPKREGVGVAFECPCGCDSRCYIPFANPLDGGPQVDKKGWQRTGNTLETLTLSPSIQRVGGCKWHGFLRGGRLLKC